MTIALCTYHPPTIADPDTGAAAADRIRGEHDAADTATADRRFAAWLRRGALRRWETSGRLAPVASPPWEVLALEADGSTRTVAVGTFDNCRDAAFARNAHPATGATRFVVVLAR